jgi:leucyl/phenylalanyl-tRNA--protein transferase
MQPEVTPELLLNAYASGIFPMAEGRDDPEIFWVDPEMRGVFDIGGLHISRSLRRQMNKSDYDVRVNSAFDHVVRACADRDETWINAEIFALYGALHEAGYAHCVEIWRGDTLIGGVYGVAIAGAFFGESMFSKETNGSKLALVYLMDRLQVGGYQLFDTQFITDHLASLGCREIERALYHKQLNTALDVAADFNTLDAHHPPVQDVLQRNTQTS